MRLQELASRPNLRLAWRRITTGGNSQYKKLFRSLYVAYEVSLDKNLEDLRQRLLGAVFRAHQPERIYLPKATGLHRPVSLLHLEDQVVLQAFANLAAKKLHERRAPLQFKVVFSNILQHDDSIFFFRRWRETYAAFQQRIRKHFVDGLRWVADFDLAAFYDTISHELLIKTIYPRTPRSSDIDWLLTCLRTWSSEKAASMHGHGIPQGPIASDFLAECFLLPIDLVLRSRRGYTRYVDDVRLFGKTEDDVRASVIELERRCREHGLIPQLGKFAVKYAKTVQEAMGMLPSIADPHRSAAGKPSRMSRHEAVARIKSALRGRPYRVVDKTRLRYVLYRAEPDSRLLKVVVRLMTRHPEHADAFFTYLSSFRPRKPISRSCLDLVEKSPYAYIRGEAWQILAAYGATSGTIGIRIRKGLVEKAVTIAKKRQPDSFAETLGACQFLAATERVAGHHYSRFLKYQPALLQAFAAQTLPDTAFAYAEAAESYLRRTEFEPGLAICSRIHALGLGPATFKIDPGDLPSQVRNTMSELGTLPTPGQPVDPIGEVLERRYGLVTSKSWHTLLLDEYVHALGLLKFAEAAFDASKSYWLANQNSFNHAVFLALQRHLASTGHSAACTTRARDGTLVDFGVMLDEHGPFSKNCPNAGDCFRAMNKRRNQLPVSHPYEKKTEKRAQHLTKRERDRFVEDMRSAMSAFVALMP